MQSAAKQMLRGASACQKRAPPFFDKLSKHFQNFHKSSENAVIENERHP